MSEEWDQDPECFLISFNQLMSCRFIKYKGRKGYFIIQSGSFLLLMYPVSSDEIKTANNSKVYSWVQN